MSDGFKEYYGEIALQQIEELKNRLSEKEEENSKQKQKLEENSRKLEENSTKLKENAKLLKEKDIALLKLLMKAEKLDFDEAFNTLKLSENLSSNSLLQWAHVKVIVGAAIVFGTVPNFLANAVCSLQQWNIFVLLLLYLYSEILNSFPQ